MRVRFAIVGVPVCLLVLLGWAGAVGANSFDLSTMMTGPYGAGPGGAVGVTVSYHNAGPDSAETTWIVVAIPSGVPVPLDELTQTHLDELVASVVPDGLGNTANVYYDLNDCEHLWVAVETPGGGYITGLDPGVTGSTSFDLAMPMDPPELGGFVIDDPPSLAREFKPTIPISSQWLVASDFGRYSRGECTTTGNLCDDLRTCFGGRLAFTDPIVGDLELVDDGSADPTFGCLDLIGYTPGTIAVIERGGCEFGLKALNAQDAGATAVVIVNNGTCNPPNFPDSPKCAITMGAGLVGDQVTIPVIQLSLNDGQPIVDSLSGGTPVHGSMGTVAEYVTLDSLPFVDSMIHGDPDTSNDLDAIDMRWGYVFVDGFESGDTTAWGNTVP
jgi:hypothetical protein